MFPFYVIRHSERLDEVDEDAWKRFVTQTYSTTSSGRRPSAGPTPVKPPSGRVSSKTSSSVKKTTPQAVPLTPRKSRDKQYFSQDPILSNPQGIQYANDMANTMLQVLLSTQQPLNLTSLPPITHTNVVDLPPIPLLLPILQESPPTSDTPLPQDNPLPQEASLPQVVAPPVRIYCSKLRRAIQTAIPLARLLQVPIYLSTGLSMVTPPVKKAGAKVFQFHSIDELQQEYPDVMFIDIDFDVKSSSDLDVIDLAIPVESWIVALHCVLYPSLRQQYGQGKKALLSSNPESNANTPRLLPVVIPTGSKLPREEILIPSNVINIIVGHRETIRGIAGEYLNTPYCCISKFLFDVNDVPEVSNKKVTNSKRRDGVALYGLDLLVDRFGQPVASKG